MRRSVGLGVLFLIVGIGFLFQQLDVFHFSEMLATWWPLILIVIGLIQITNSHSSKMPGIIFLLLGFIFLTRELFDVNLFEYAWPILLIFIGFVFLFSKKRHHDKTDSKNVINSFSLFSGASIRSNSTHFEGGDVTTIFGGAKIDLRDVELSSEGAYLDFVSVFGGATLRIPEDMRVEISGTPIFGGWEDKTRRKAPTEMGPVLYIKCMPIFGGIEVKD